MLLTTPLQEQANTTPNLRQEQDLSKRERRACGKFTARNRGGTPVVRLAPDVAGISPAIDPSTPASVGSFEGLKKAAPPGTSNRTHTPLAPRNSRAPIRTGKFSAGG